MVANVKTKNPALAVNLKNRSATILKLMVAALPLYPAIRINLDAAQGQGETWAIVAIAFVIFGAICIEHAVHSTKDRQPFSAALWGALGAGFLALNVMNALANAASHSDHSRDHFRAQIQASATIQTQRSQLVAARAEQAKLAGETTSESIEAELQAAIAADAKRWQASEHCNPDLIGQTPTRSFCEGIHKLQAKKAASVRRDEIDASLSRLDEKAETKESTPSSVDSFADAMADAFAAFGYEVDEHDKLSITRARDWGKALGVELLAGFGPTALLLLFLRAGAPHSGAEQKPVTLAPARQTRPVGTISSLPAPTTLGQAEFDPVQAFVTRRIEQSPGAFIAAGDLWRLWCEDCEARNIEPGTQQAFGRAAKRQLTHDKNNGRPRYVNVRLKPVLRQAEEARGVVVRRAHPHLSVVNA